MTDWLRNIRRAIARMPPIAARLGLGRVPDGPAQPTRDPWPGDPARGAILMRGTFELAGGSLTLRLGGNSGGGFASITGNPILLAGAHGFVWLRDLRALGTDGARMRARSLVSEWIDRAADLPEIAQRPDVAGSRIAAWLGHYDFFAASADDGFRQRLMQQLMADARALAASLPTEELDARAFIAIKGLVAAAVALPDHPAFMSRALRVLPQELRRQILADGTHCERSPAQQLAVLQDLTEIRALLQAGQIVAPPALASGIERTSLALRMLRHGDGRLALFNGTRDESAALIELALTQAGRPGRAPAFLSEGGFHRLQAERSIVIIDCGAPPPAKLDRFSHAGTLGFEMSVGRDRLITNCGAMPAASQAWRDAGRATNAHSTLIIADTDSSELRDTGLGRRPIEVLASRQEAHGAHWLDASHDGWVRPFGAIHRRRLYLAASGEELLGEDTVESDSPQPFVIRFHLHPDVDASLQHDGLAVLLRLPQGGFWRLEAEGAAMSLDESIYLAGPAPRKSEQVVLTGLMDGPQQVKWGIARIG